MTKGELRKARKLARANNEPLSGALALDKDSGSVEFSAERNRDGSYNHRRADALDRYARFVYEYDRD